MQAFLILVKEYLVRCLH